MIRGVTTAMAKVLIVDDHAPNRDLVVTLLNHQGHQSLEAGDGGEALALVRSQRPQLVICDILMPTMDGYEFVRQLRADPAIAATEVIFYTANYHEREARHLAATVGVSRVLIKPCIPEDIIRAIDLALGHEPERVQAIDAGEFNREHLRLVTDKLAEKADDLQNANLKLSALTELNLQLASERDPDTLLDKVCNGARELIGAKYAFICIRAKNNGQAIYSFSSGLQPEEAIKLEQPDIGRGVFGEVMAESKPRRLLNPRENPEAIGLPSAYPPVHNALIVPIVSLRLMYGWICLVDKVGASEFSAEDERILSIHAAQVGRIYENGSLYVQIEKRAAELQAEVAERIAAERELNYKNSVLQTQQQASPDAILLVDKNGKIASHNQQFSDLFDLPKELIAAAADGPLLEAFTANVVDPEPFLAKVKYLYQNQDEKSADEILLKDGRIMDRYSAPVRDDEGAYYGRVWYFRDITERKKAEEKIKRLNRVYAVLSGINALIVRAKDRDELLRESCRIVVDLGGFVSSDIIIMDPDSRTTKLVASSIGNPRYLELIRQIMANPPGDAKPVFDRLIGERQPAIFNDIAKDLPASLQDSVRITESRSSCVLPLIVANRTIGLLTLRAREKGFFDAAEMQLLVELAGDIAFALDHLEKSARLDYLAYYDQLTGLANRTLFFDRLAQVIEAAGRDKHMVAVLVMNVDRFKNINDTLGRQSGDELLKQIAARFEDDQKKHLRHARISADTFAILIPEVGNADDVARQIELKLKNYFGKPYRIDDAELRISGKFGVALFPADGADPETLYRNAEAALKKAKTGGARYLFHTQKMTERVAGRLSLENKLRRAVEYEEFVLHYQPKVTLEDRRIVGVEALIRWNDPATGLVPPIEFIPLLEETGLILEVGAWALRRAILDHARWQGLGLAAPRVAVNVSPVQLRLSDYVEVVRQAITEGASPPGVDIEITESVIMEDIEGNIEKLKTIRDMGISISIDDFGTGYSSLAYLAKLPVGEIKIDRSFIITMLQDTNTMTLVSTIVALAHSMGLKVIAEGVDQEEQAEVLRHLGCELMQGYLFSKPLPFEAMAALLARAA